jgi:hypothetical protein
MGICYSLWGPLSTGSLFYFRVNLEQDALLKNDMSS